MTEIQEVLHYKDVDEDAHIKKKQTTVESDNLVDTLNEIRKNGFEIMCTSLEGSKSVYEVDFNKKVIVIGNEANGVSKEVQDMADVRVKIPMLGKTESLNASVAAGIMIYEYVRGKVQ